jgi:hypothetical protein
MKTLVLLWTQAASCRDIIEAGSLSHTVLSACRAEAMFFLWERHLAAKSVRLEPIPLSAGFFCNKAVQDAKSRYPF